MTRRAGRLSIRVTPDFLDLCARTAQDRGLTLTEFTEQSLMLNILRKPVSVTDLKTQILASVGVQ